MLCVCVELFVAWFCSSYMLFIMIAGMVFKELMTAGTKEVRDGKSRVRGGVCGCYSTKEHSQP